MNNQINNHLNLFGTLILSIVALVNQEISVFYMLYLFWWQEIIAVFESVFSKLKRKTSFSLAITSLGNSLFLMGIYLIFIVIFFGFVLSFRNEKLMMIFFDVLMFKNLSFNINLLLAMVLMIFKVVSNQINREKIGIFSTNMVVLHVSIILVQFYIFSQKNIFMKTLLETAFCRTLFLPFLFLF